MDLKNEKPTRLYLIRHGEVEKSRQGKYNGHSNVKLSQKGIQQFHELAEFLSKEPIQAVYSSDLDRTRMGAEIIANRFGLDVQVQVDLREKDFGKWEGLTPEEVSREFPNQWNEWLKDPVNTLSPEGESYRKVFERVKHFLTETLKVHEQQEVVIVSHGGVNRLVLANALHLDLRHVLRIEQKFGALNIIDFYPNIAVIKLLNG